MVFTNQIEDVVCFDPSFFLRGSSKVSPREKRLPNELKKRLRDNANAGHNRTSSKCSLSREREKSQNPSYFKSLEGKTSSFPLKQVKAGMEFVRFSG